MKIIDISGLGHSGKTSVTDLLREVNGITVHYGSFEFGLLRLPDGMIDLKSAIVDNWSPVRSDFAIKRFKKLYSALAPTYVEFIHPDFLKLSEEYAQSIVTDTLLVNWYDSLYDTFPGYKTKIKAILKIANLLTVFRTLKKKVPGTGNHNKNTVYLVDNSDFIQKTKDYLIKILSIYKGAEIQTVVTNNTFEPFNPEKSMELFDDAFCVIVDRDPRDIYLSALNSQGLFIPDFEKNNPAITQKFIENQKQDMLGTHNIGTFIERQKIYRKNIVNSDNPRIIRIHYEDMIYNYEKTVKELFIQLDIDPKKHIYKKKYFNPEISKKNVGLWKNHKHLREITLIEKELKDYLYITK